MSAASLAPSKPSLPEAPSTLTDCYKRKLPSASASADELVAERLKREAKLEACLRKWPEWYAKLRKANGVEAKG